MTSGGPESRSSVAKWIKSRTGIAVTAVLAVVIVLTLVVTVILSPSMSPLASFHDADGDGYTDADDEFPDDPSEWNDADDDGWGDNTDEFPNDAEEYIDSDDDGVGDNSDAFPDDPTETLDSDGDGYGDNCDVFPNDPEKSSPSVLMTTDTSCFVARQVFESVVPQFDWDDLMVSISDGSDTVNWEPKSDDLDDGGYLSHDYDTCELGDIQVFLRAADALGDGFVSAQDTVEIRVNGSTFAYGIDYDWTLSYEPTGSALDEFTFSCSAFTPTTTLTTSDVTDGYRFTFGASDISDMPWDVLTFELSDGLYEASWANISGTDLDDELEDIQNFGDRDLGALSVTMAIIDVSGNGIVDQDDYIELTAHSFEVDTTYTIAVVYEPTGEDFASTTFGSYSETPEAWFAKTRITDGWMFTFLVLTADVNWSYVQIVVTDGTNSAAWTNITYSDLDGGIIVLKNYGSTTLGALEVTLRIMDLKGNGEVNQGDYFELLAEFDGATDYLVTVMYEPTSAPMGQMFFTG